MGCTLAIKIFGILITLFSIIFALLGMQNPYTMDLKNYALDFKNVEAHHLYAYELNASSVKSYYEAKTWTRYNDKDVFKNFVNLGGDFNLSANSLEVLGKKQENIVFEGDVVYISDEVKIMSEKVKYNTASKQISTDTNFKALFNDNVVKGNTLNYDTKNKILKVQGVNAWLVN